MAVYHQLKFPSIFIEYRSVSEWKGVVVIIKFDSLEAAPVKSTAIGSCLVCLRLNTPLDAWNRGKHAGVTVHMPKGTTSKGTVETRR